MAYAVTALQNIEEGRLTGEAEILHLPGDPGVTFTKGEVCSLSNGVLILGTDSAAGAVFRVVKTTVCPAASQEFVMPSDFLPRRGEAKDLCLVPVEVLLGPGHRLIKGNIGGANDETVVSYDSATRGIACTTGFGADDRPNGSLLYVYEGPGIGEVNIVEDYDHADGASELLLICHRKFKATLTSSSKFVVFGSGAATNGLGLFGRCDLKDEDELHCLDGADDGDYTLWQGWENLHNALRLGQGYFLNSANLW